MEHDKVDIHDNYSDDHHDIITFTVIKVVNTVAVIPDLNTLLIFIKMMCNCVCK